MKHDKTFSTLGQRVVFTLEMAEALTETVGTRDLLRNELFTVIDVQGIREPLFTLQSASGDVRHAFRSELLIFGASSEECRFFTARGWAIH